MTRMIENWIEGIVPENLLFELLIEAEIFKPEKLESLMKEADELMAIFVSSVKKVKARK